MIKCIVTGGAGFIGSHLVSKLNRTGYDIVVIDNFTTGNPNYLAHHIFSRTPAIDINSYDFEDLVELCTGAEYIFHMAAYPSVQKSIECPIISAQDTLSTVRMLEVARRIKAKFIFSSSCSVYGEPPKLKPLSPYAQSKNHGEQHCKMYQELYNLDIVCLRYYNVYGTRMSNTGAYRSVLSVFIEAMKENKKLNIVNDGEQKREFVHVDDVVYANMQAMRYNCKGSEPHVFDVSSGIQYSINEIADMFGGEKQYGETRIEPKKILKSSIIHTKKFLQWEPSVSLADWIKETSSDR